MQLTQKRLRLALAALILAAGIAAVTFAGARASASPAAKKASGNVLTVGIALDPPWTLQTPSGHLISFNPALLARLSRYLHEKVQLVSAGWTGIVAGLVTGKYQMIGADLNATAERRKVIDFTIPYYYSGTTWFVPGNSPYKTLADLNKPSVTIAFIGGSDTETTTRSTLPHATVPLAAKRHGRSTDRRGAGRSVDRVRAVELCRRGTDLAVPLPCDSVTDRRRRAASCPLASPGPSRRATRPSSPSSMRS